MSGYPSAGQIEAAGLDSLIWWMRFLPSPSDDDRPKMERILERAADLRGRDGAGWVAASKRVGHGA